MRPGQFIFGLMVGVLLSAALVWSAVVFQLGVPDPGTLSTRNNVNFKIHAAQQIVGPKMLICAGSSSFLGLRADLITQATGIPTINMGVMAALGLPTSCRWARELAKPGDIVLLAFEYNLYDWREMVLNDKDEGVSSVLYNELYVGYVVSYDPDYFRSLSLLDQAKVIINLTNKRIFDGVLRKFQTFFRKEAPVTIRQPQGMDEYGDAVGATMDRRPPQNSLNDVIYPLVSGLPANPAGFAYLHDFIGWCHAHQVRVLATWPNLLYRPEYLEPTGRKTVARIREFYESQGVTVIGNFEDALLPREDFFDTVYHLTDPEAEKRTRRLLEQWPK